MSQWFVIPLFWERAGKILQDVLKLHEDKNEFLITPRLRVHHRQTQHLPEVYGYPLHVQYHGTCG